MCGCESECQVSLLGRHLTVCVKARNLRPTHFKIHKTIFNKTRLKRCMISRIMKLLDRGSETSKLEHEN